jgi:hypothetical protein
MEISHIFYSVYLRTQREPIKCSCLGAFSDLRNLTVSFVTFVCPSIPLSHGTALLPLDGVSWNVIFEHFSKIYWEGSSFIKFWQVSLYFYKNCYPLYKNQYIFLIIRVKSVVDRITEKVKTYILRSMAFVFRNLYHLWDNVEKCCRAKQYTDDNIAHALCMLDT